MRRPLFLKIFLGVCLSFIVVVNLVWFVDSLLQQNPSRGAERFARVGLAGAASAIRLGGESALREQLDSWPDFDRANITYRRIESGAEPGQDLFHRIFSTTATDPEGHRYAITYRVSRFDRREYVPFVFDMGPRVLTATFIAILIFSAALTFYLILPISRIRAAFGRLAGGDLKVRLGGNWLRRRDEIADMASDFNRMAERLEELVTSRDRLLADISHELRSPLSRLYLAIALARQSPDKTQQSLERISREADKLDEMVGELLALTKIESGITTSSEYFFVSEIAAIVAGDARYEAQEKGVLIDLVASPKSQGEESLVMGSGKLVSRAVENIVRNALRFSRRGDTITLEMETNAAGSTLYIRDEGPGVKADQLALLFEPFVQADTTSGQGYGLGLSIAKRAILAHRGTIEAANNARGGLIITIWMPAAHDAPQDSAHGRSVWDRSVSPLPV
ncbi:MAG TPA: ATP-binding protein [Rhizomicrobium sp.]|nr:ATP-binding protein [Rhizomicrobium sp.]